MTTTFGVAENTSSTSGRNHITNERPSTPLPHIRWTLACIFKSTGVSGQGRLVCMLIYLCWRRGVRWID